MRSICRCLTITLLLAAIGLPATGLPATGLPDAIGMAAQPGRESQSGATPQKAPAPTPPLEWVDPATGHRVVRLSREPGSSSLYFHQNGYTAGGDKMVFTTREGLSAYNFKTRDIEPLVQGRVGDVIVGKKTRQVFYFKRN